MKAAVRAYGPAAFWAIALLVLGAQSGLRSPIDVLPLNIPVDKAAHFALYGILGALAAWGWVRAGGRPAPWLLILAGLSVGALDELHQMTVASRSAEFGDWVADAAGVIVGFLIVSRWPIRTRPRSRIRR